MQTATLKKALSLILCIVLIAAMALTTFGCNGNETNDAGSASVASTGTSSQATEASADVTVLGEGAKVFAFTVTDLEGKETAFEIHTDKEMVGEALLDLGLIAGDQGAYGLYVKTVNGITADYDKDGKYWAFYVDGTYASSGVDTTQIEEGKTYSFKIE